MKIAARWRAGLRAGFSPGSSARVRRVPAPCALRKPPLPLGFWPSQDSPLHKSTFEIRDSRKGYLGTPVHSTDADAWRVNKASVSLAACSLPCPPLGGMQRVFSMRATLSSRRVVSIDRATGAHACVRVG